MANITLPNNPVNGQTVVIGTRLFQYDSTANRWKSRVFQVLGDTSVTVTNESPTITASLSEIALDTSGANVSFTYTVSDVDSSVLKVSHSVSGIANSDLATVTHHRANNTVTITAGTEEFSGGQITLTVTDGRNNATDTVDVSLALPVAFWSDNDFLVSLDTTSSGITDKTGNITSFTVGTGTTYSTSETKYDTASIAFNNSRSAKVEFDLGSTIGTNEFCAEVWFNKTSTSNLDAGYGVILAISGFTLYAHPDNKIRAGLPNGSIDSSATFSNGTWNHLAITRRSASVQIDPGVNVWLNGVKIIYSNHDNNRNMNVGTSVAMGGSSGSGNYPLVGYVEGLQIVNNAVKYRSQSSWSVPSAEQGPSYQATS